MDIEGTRRNVALAQTPGRRREYQHSEHPGIRGKTIPKGSRREEIGDFDCRGELEGVYRAKCLLHYGICMIVMVAVGASAKVDQAKAVPEVGKAKQAASKNGV